MLVGRILDQLEQLLHLALALEFPHFILLVDEDAIHQRLQLRHVRLTQCLLVACLPDDVFVVDLNVVTSSKHDLGTVASFSEASWWLFDWSLRFCIFLHCCIRLIL